MKKFFSMLCLCLVGFSVSANAALSASDINISTSDFMLVAISVIGAVAVIWGIRKAIGLINGDDGVSYEDYCEQLGAKPGDEFDRDGWELMSREEYDSLD
ncbi:hypothetical protein AGMMS50229_06960 [Campylobacterota bacterium]|nr:hypothetical protein AGMMS50229_06960 [Campylobacterota bacterium]